jgi:hypothetical protein
MTKGGGGGHMMPLDGAIETIGIHAAGPLAASVEPLVSAQMGACGGMGMSFPHGLVAAGRRAGSAMRLVGLRKPAIRHGAASFKNLSIVPRGTYGILKKFRLL